MPKKPYKTLQTPEKPAAPPKKWWEIATDLISKTDGLIKAVATLLAAIVLVWGLYTPKPNPPPNPPGPDTSDKKTTGTSGKDDTVDDPNDVVPRPRPSETLVGWMYVGSRVGQSWWRDHAEPAKTLDTEAVPSPGSQYDVTASVFLRRAPPNELPNGDRPSMEPIIVRGGKQLAVNPGMRVKVDNIRMVVVKQVPNVERTWVWAHVTVLQP
ncbi:MULTISPECIES: hypothetical protein [unclassified Variovorax]|uniref:hypothetical protein n=1 Tax=unclassified Variovorax TaxID=663243 RepID=UPI003F45A415